MLICASITNARGGGIFSCESHALRSEIVVLRENAMDVLLGAVALIAHAIEAVLGYVESHHWIFGLAALGYIFYLHDRALHARFDALDKRVDEIRKRLAVEY